MNPRVEPFRVAENDRPVETSTGTRRANRATVAFSQWKIRRGTIVNVRPERKSSGRPPATRVSALYRTRGPYVRSVFRIQSDYGTTHLVLSLQFVDR